MWWPWSVVLCTMSRYVLEGACARVRRCWTLEFHWGGVGKGLETGKDITRRYCSGQDTNLDLCPGSPASIAGLCHEIVDVLLQLDDK
jgi:hypothetical protein